MATIATNRPLVTLVNVFRVQPARQQALVDLLVTATEEVICHLPGYISANIHQSLDGTHVVNYAQWRSEADFVAMGQQAAARAHMERAYELAEAIEPHLYRVVFTHERPD
jgi:heme-degrading monooxygenase HmoA